MKNFKTPLAISGSKEQIKSLEQSLIDLGYKWSWSTRMDRCDPFLITKFGGQLNQIGYNQADNGNKIVPAFNPNLVLALAAMVEGDEYYIGEYVVALQSSTFDFYTKGRLYQIRLVNEIYLTINIDREGKNDTWRKKFFRKATVEEIMNHFFNLNTSSSQINSPVFKIGDRVKVISGGSGAFGADGEVGVIISKPKPIGSFSYNGELYEKAEVFIKTDDGKIFGLASGFQLSSQKIIGYKVKQEVSKLAAARAIDSISDSWTSDHAFDIGSSDAKKAIGIGVLDLLFEPVYEEEKRFIEIFHGKQNDRKALKVEIITRYGEKQAVAENQLFHKEDLQEVLIPTKRTTLFKPTYFDVGCNGQYHNVSAKDIQKVIDAL